MTVVEGAVIVTETVTVVATVGQEVITAAAAEGGGTGEASSMDQVAHCLVVVRVGRGPWAGAHWSLSTDARWKRNRGSPSFSPNQTGNLVFLKTENIIN